MFKYFTTRVYDKCSEPTKHLFSVTGNRGDLLFEVLYISKYKVRSPKKLFVKK